MSLPLPESFLARPIAHRALHGPGRPENSRAAIRAAVEAGYAVEIDLQLSRDGVPKVFHDAALDRLTLAAGPVRERTAAELREIPLRGSDEGIPPFAEVLDLVAGRVPLLVELKDQSGEMGESDGTFEGAVAEIAADYQGDLAFMSFNPSLVAGMARAAPERPFGITTEAYSNDGWRRVPEPRRLSMAALEGVERIGVGFISHDWRDLAMPRVEEIKANGLPILCWTVRSAEEEAQARRRADNITFEGYLPDTTP